MISSRWYLLNQNSISSIEMDQIDFKYATGLVFGNTNLKQICNTGSS